MIEKSKERQDMTAENLSLLNYIFLHTVHLFLMPMALAGTVCGVLVSKINLQWKLLDNAIRIAVNLDFTAILIVATAYLFYPNYLDHVESTTASLGEIFRHGGQIYPALTEYSMHGLLYGPGLSELQSLFLSFGMPVIFASKIPGVLALLVSVVLFGRIFQDNFARSYLVLLIPFGVFLFWNRAEPLFLLLIALSISLLARSRNTGTALLIGCFAGFATCLKLHAMLYVFAAVVVVWQSELLTVKRCLAMTAGWLVTVFVAFSPSQVSPSNFVLYLELAGKHGISVSGLSRNLFCLAILFAPVIFLTITKAVKSRKQIILIAILFTIELVVAVIASKPGAGPHHLLPFIPINAFLILQMVKESPHIERSLMPFKFGILTISLGSLFMLILLARQMCLQYPLQLELKEEADSLADKYPGIVLGVSDSENYDYVFFRPLLEAKGNRQIDYPAYMDLNFSGVTDYRFVQTLRACKIRYLALPVYGEPFSIINSYTGQPLFSQAVRASFGEYYTTLAETNHYRVYRCKIETVE